MVNLASSVDCGHTRLTTTTLQNMAAILKLIRRLRHATLAYSVHILYWTSMFRSIDICQNKVSADQYHVVTISQAQA